ncbi:hypothetical protein FI667_g14214, partial [Globisporangium splendens]
MAPSPSPLTSVSVVLRAKQSAFPALQDVVPRLDAFLDYSVHWSVLLAVQEGLPHLLRRLGARDAEISTEKLGVAMQCATKRGDLAMLQWLHAYRPSVRIPSAAMDKAAEKGHVAIAQWLHESVEAASCSEHAMESAAANGHLEMVQWLHAHYEDTSRRASRNAMQLAARGGHASVLRFLDANYPNEGCRRTTAMRAAEFGRVSVLQYMQQTHPDEFHRNELVAIARRCKKPDVVAWLSE